MGRKTTIAIAYDFDGTLTPGNMQEYSFIPSLNIDKNVFWKEVDKLTEENNMDKISAYMYLMLKKADEKDLPINKESFKKHGEEIALFEGLNEWFRRINTYAKSKNIVVNHYVVSSGLEELIEGSSIRKEFKYVFASGYMYDTNGVAKWPARAVNYTTKTQFIFRINKGLENCWDDSKINDFMPEEKRAIPFKHIIYVGDGETDIPCMKIVKSNGGYAIAVYPPKKQINAKIKALVTQQRADYLVPADYKEDSKIDVLIKKIINKIQADVELTKEKK